jgi:hypothetical protein
MSKKPFVQVLKSLVTDTSLSTDSRVTIIYLLSKKPDWEPRVLDIIINVGLTEKRWRRVSQELRERKILTVYRSPQGSKIHFARELANDWNSTGDNNSRTPKTDGRQRSELVITNIREGLINQPPPPKKLTKEEKDERARIRLEAIRD